MITTLAARWPLTAVFAAAGLTAALPRRSPAGSAQPAEFGCFLQRDVRGCDRMT
jgi:hypothetical protein